MYNDQFEWIISLMICFFVITGVFLAILIMELSATQREIKAIKDKMFKDNG